MSFVHLHTHTQYSLLDGSNKIVNYVQKVKNLGMNAAAITDHGVMYGVIDFYKECKKQGINPVLGCEVYVAPGSRFDREISKGDDRYYHLILLAENNEGYQNLMKIVSIGFVDGFYYKPRVDFETLEKYHEGLICLSACLAGEVARELARDNYEVAKEVALKYEACFGKGNYFLEMQDHGIAAQQKVNAGLMRMHEETGIELVVTNDCHYTDAEDAEAHDLLLCIQTGKKVQDTDRMRYEGGQYFVKSEEEMKNLFPYAKEAVENTQKIAERCHVEIEFGHTKLPHFEVPEGYNSWTYLNKLCFDGLERRYGEKAPEMKPQLEYELNVIKTMGYVDYFLIVWDFINYARSVGIPVGPGRGSAAGSLVSYTTGITNIDPVRYQLFFERFLNPDRVSMPDIDVDICYERRGEVISYVVDKYGADCVTQIITFGTLKAKNAIRDVGRVLDYPYAYVDDIAKSIPNELNITIKGALEKNHELRERYESVPQVHELIDYAISLEGLPRNAGTHAAGVVISQSPMDEFVPLALSSDGLPVTQFTMTTIEELGLLKMDFLGLRTLTVIKDACDMVKENHGVDIDFDTMECDDPAIFQLISSGKTEGIFQLESAGMKSFMKELKPESLEDVIAGISLYRPGPMDFIPNYIKGKNNKDAVTYDCPQLEPILKPTYGCIVYQEQVMQIVRDLAGFSLGRSDEVRRAMSKKKTKVMEQERQSFVYGNEEAGIPGCIKNGISEAVANKIYDDMIDFAKYAFNKAHAACYAVVGYQTAYLRYYYPVEFFAALMTSMIGNTSKISEYIQVCRNMNIELLPPDINEGGGTFKAVNGKIRYGMYAIKSLGRPVIDAIVKNREENGNYQDLEDFIRRVGGSEVNKRAIENLILAGALDSLPGNRKAKSLVYMEIMDAIVNTKKNSMEGQMSLFDLAPEESKDDFSFKLPEVDEFDRETLLMKEKDILGIYVSGHPLEEYMDVLEENVTAKSLEFMLEDGASVANIEDDKEVVVGGMLTEVKIHYTKKNQTMAFLTLEDLYGTIELIIFPRDFEKYRKYLREDEKVLVRGRVSLEEEKNAKMIVSEIIPFANLPKTLWIQFEKLADYNEDELRKRLGGNEGTDSIIIYIRDTKQIKRLPKNWDVTVTEELKQSLMQAYGEENIRVVQEKL